MFSLFFNFSFILCFCFTLPLSFIGFSDSKPDQISLPTRTFFDSKSSRHILQVKSSSSHRNIPYSMSVLYNKVKKAKYYPRKKY